jgi:tetratricopeptide (TPR) repeat protein
MESEELFLRVLSVPLFVQFGKSGLGKTSLLQASLFPRLRQKPFLPVMIRLNVAEETLTQAVARSIEQACKAEGLEFPDVRREGLWELLSTALVRRYDLPISLVLVFDQFEEVFNLRDAAFRNELAIELGALLTGTAPKRAAAAQDSAAQALVKRPEVKIILSLREEYLGELEEFSEAIPGLFHERLRLGPLTEEGAREAITEPARVTAQLGEEPYWSPRFKLEPAALAEMVGFLKGESGVIEPFQLQLLCRHAEAVAHDKADKSQDLKADKSQDFVELRLQDFTGSRQFDLVLRDFYREALNKLPSAQRENVEELCEHGLLDHEGHRLMLEEGQIQREFGVDAAALEVLAHERLVRREPRLESVFYEISHDQWAKTIFGSRKDKLPKKERERIRFLERSRWQLGVAAACLGMVAVALLLLFAYAYNEKMEAVAAEDRAVQARDNAEKLVSFLLGERFLGEIRDSGRSMMLKSVQTQVGEGENQFAQLNSGLALRNAGDIERIAGHLDKATALFDLALKVMEDSPDSADRRPEMARSQTRIAEALEEEGKVTEALRHHEAAVDIWRQLVSSASRATELDAASMTDICISLAESLASAGALQSRLGKTQLALVDKV